MTYLIYVAMFGAGATIFLWLRDARIFFRTGLAGYRKAAYMGVLYGALAGLGLQITYRVPDFEILGLGLILAGIYLVTNQKKEKVWKNETTFQRFLGSVPINRTNKK
ncbi:ABC transporter permease [uncultured Methanoregula sp.]|uniref:ABC transporter permease n=1 Tax=uncultured Methanoregula sp. TaxID=1005933 RepID=UPI002AAAB14E|nr:ABC transporter permease [uncultured Methanoregula sp.]